MEIGAIKSRCYYCFNKKNISLIGHGNALSTFDSAISSVYTLERQCDISKFRIVQNSSFPLKYAPPWAFPPCSIKGVGWGLFHVRQQKNMLFPYSAVLNFAEFQRIELGSVASGYTIYIVVDSGYTIYIRFYWQLSLNVFKLTVKVGDYHWLSIAICFLLFEMSKPRISMCRFHWGKQNIEFHRIIEM